jgi:hypothetical protein
LDLWLFLPLLLVEADKLFVVAFGVREVRFVLNVFEDIYGVCFVGGLNG